MARDLIHAMSPNAFLSKVRPDIAANKQPLPHSAKMFLAVARAQAFDAKPEIVSSEDVNARIVAGHVELNRGLRPTPGLSARFYADQLFSGAFYPGVIVVFGHGIYMAETSETDIKPAHPHFPKISKVALNYATWGGVTGVVLRSVLKPGANTIGIDDLKLAYSEERNRLEKMEIKDLGTFAAALGYDAYFIDEAFDYAEERTWVVVNRSMLVFQKRGWQLTDAQLQPDEKSLRQ